MVIGHVDSFIQCRTSKRVWLPVATKIATRKFYLLFKYGKDFFVQVCISLFSYFHTYCMNVSMPYRMISNTFNKPNPNITVTLITQTGDLKFASGN